MLNESQKQIFNLNGINIECSFHYKWSYLPELGHMASHIEFRSVINEKPNDISDTGYQSEFIMNRQHDAFIDIKDLIIQYLELNKIKIQNLDFEAKEEQPVFVQESFLFS